MHSTLLKLMLHEFHFSRDVKTCRSGTDPREMNERTNALKTIYFNLQKIKNKSNLGMLR